MRDQFLDRLEQGLQATGKSLDDLAAEDSSHDVLSAVMADKSGQFLKTYAIDHGHNSLREASVVHLAVERVSQLGTRFVQRERRCSFEESSTRYISFSAETHWRDPEVVAAGGEVLAAYDAVLRNTFALYGELTTGLFLHLQRVRPLQADEKEGPWLRALKAEAFDAARYLLTPAIYTKWGLVADARTLSDIVTELTSHPLAEFRIVGDRLRQQAELALPTLLAHSKPNAFLQHQHEVLRRLAGELQVRTPPSRPATAASGNVTLLQHDPDLDHRLLAALLYEHNSEPFATLQAAVRAMTDGQRQTLLDQVLGKRGKHDAWPAGLEGAQPFDFEVLLDFGAYRDVGRHRKGFHQQQTLTTGHGFAVPPLVEDAGLRGRYGATARCSRAPPSTSAPSPRRFPLAAGYVTPFAFLQRVRIVFEPRQLCYFIELRSGPEGHFSYPKVALDSSRTCSECCRCSRSSCARSRARRSSAPCSRNRPPTNGACAACRLPATP